MVFAFELVSTAGQNSIDATLKFASTTAAHVRRLLNLQLDLAAEITHASIENLQTPLTKPATVDSFASWQSAWQSHIDRMQEIGRGYFAEVSQMQKAIAELIGEQVAVMNKSAITSSEDRAKTEQGEDEKAQQEVEHSGKKRRAP